MSQLLLATKELTKSFGGLVAVNNVAIEVKEGVLMGLIGPNGSGKTTLFNLITGFEKPDKGKVKYKGIDITGWSPYQITNVGISRTFQLVRPLHNMTVLENVTLPCLSPRGRSFLGDQTPVEKASEIIGLVGLKEASDKLAKVLTHGELKRLEIAKALATNPELLLLDEPLAGLSREEVETITSLVKRLHDEGHTIIMVEHRLRELMRLVHWIVVLNQGRKIAEGTPKEVAANIEVIEAYMGRQAYLA